MAKRIIIVEDSEGNHNIEWEGPDSLITFKYHDVGRCIRPIGVRCGVDGDLQVLGQEICRDGVLQIPPPFKTYKSGEMLYCLEK